MYTLIYIRIYTSVTAEACSHKKKQVTTWLGKGRKHILRLLHCTLQNVYTETTLGSKSTERNKEHCSLHIRGGITIYSHEWTMSHGSWNFLIYSRINIFSLRYCYSSCKLHLTLDRSREARYWKQTDFKYRSCNEIFIFLFFFCFIYSRLVVI